MNESDLEKAIKGLWLLVSKAYKDRGIGAAVAELLYSITMGYVYWIAAYENAMGIEDGYGDQDKDPEADS